MQNKRAKARFFHIDILENERGLHLPVFSSRVLNGKSNISIGLAIKLATLFKMSRTEAEYFELLVQYSQSKTNSEKSRFFDKIVGFRKLKVKKMAPSELDLFSKWYYVVVRELIDTIRFKGDFADLAKRVVPALSLSEARAAVSLLARLNMISRGADGVYVRTEAVMTTGSEHRSVAVMNFQMAMMDLSREAFNRFAREERDISSLTLSISEEAFNSIRDKLAHTRSEILTIAKNDNNASRVYQLNLQFFPLSKSLKGGNS